MNATTPPRNLPEACSQHFLGRENAPDVASPGALLSGDPARPPLGEAQYLAEIDDRVSPARWARQLRQATY